MTHIWQRFDFVLLEGDTRQDLRQLAVETDADLLMLGHRNTGPERRLALPFQPLSFWDGQLGIVALGRARLDLFRQQPVNTWRV